MSTKVLLVEDDPAACLILARRLRISGYEVLTASDAEQALGILEGEPVSLIVSDWMMTGMDGLELCRRVKDNPSLSPNYFIMMTARVDKGHCVQALKAGADDYLSKPVDENELLASLRVGERALAKQKDLHDLASTDPVTSFQNIRSFEEDPQSEVTQTNLKADCFSLPPDKGTILVVDDEPVTRKILSKGLTAFGYTVFLAEDGEGCLEILQKEEPKVLVLDWILPGIDGMDVCRTIRSDDRIKTPYIIMVTIVGGIRSRIYALENGADDYIHKPIDMDELLARVKVGMRIEDLKAKIAGAEKLEGVIQMAGAVAHELSQPLTAIMGLADLVLMKTDASDPNYQRLEQLLREALRLSELTKKIGRIMKYETREYLGNTKIVDIHKASRGNDVIE